MHNIIFIENSHRKNAMINQNVTSLIWGFKLILLNKYMDTTGKKSFTKSQ